MRENLTSKKPKLNQIIRIKLILIGLLLAYSLYQVLNWNLFPWFNFVVIFGSSFLSLIFALVVKIQSRIIKILILTIASIQLFISAIFHTFHELLRVNWQWLFFLPHSLSSLKLPLFDASAPSFDACSQRWFLMCC